jgi:hypothetical protein
MKAYFDGKPCIIDQETIGVLVRKNTELDKEIREALKQGKILLMRRNPKKKLTDRK